MPADRDELAQDDSILEGLVEGAREGLAGDGLDPLLGLLLKLGAVRGSTLLSELSVHSWVSKLEQKVSKKDLVMY
jgi:hypothetical protein